MIVRAYYLMTDPSGDEPTLVPVLRTVPETSAKLHAALDALLAGPTAKERAANPRLVTMISSGTTLLSVKLDGGEAIVNLSDAFLSGSGDAAVRARIGQVVYTATQFASVDGVTIMVNGEGYSDAMYGRGSFRDVLLPSIFVDRPAWGASYISDTEISGVANVFEAQFLVAVYDHQGIRLDDAAVTASCGSGCWGAFSTKLHYDVTAAQWGELRAWDISEADSSVIDLRTYPVYLRP